MKLIIGLFKLVFYMIKMVVQTIIFLGLIGLCIFVYARYIEPELLIIHEEVIISETLSSDRKALKIAQFSDTHLGEDYTLNNLKKTVVKINENTPDIIVFTGDLIDNNKEYEDAEAIIRELTALKAKLAKVAVYGNHDHGGNGTRRYKQIMERSGFILLDNSSYIIDLGNNQKINIMGIDDLLLGSPDIKKATQNINKAHYNVFISHAPDIADEVKAYPIDLQLSGHSHGGQVTIPFIGSPLTPPYAKKYIKGMYEIEGNTRMRLYVNSGLGTSQLKYRFLNIPEITVFKLEFK
ncbi:metallophosphoesterase [Cellulosilyticum sp. I15G10I2]|uniref:metallophosphoesterase n=1 Tax=Cellulosilyticum sp. I15G10I2 TaxID=1892843 RepID=UPI00085C7C4D|nr:metallophosphoesterase [Cellulosilyticum sp. I15G10I2]